MRKVLLALVPWMAMATAAQAERVPATVVYTYQGSYSDRVQRDGSECYVPISLAENWGWKVTTSGREADIYAEGRVLRIELTPDKKIPLTEALKQLGAVGEWDAARKNFRVLASIRSIDILFDTFRVSTTLAVQPVSFTLDNPDRLVIDLEGTTISPDLDLSSLPGVRAKQYTPTAVRVVMERPDARNLRFTSRPTRNIEVNLPVKKQSDPASAPTPVVTSNAQENERTAKPAPTGQGLNVGAAEVEEVNNLTTISFDLGVSPTLKPSFKSSGLTKFQVVLPPNSSVEPYTGFISQLIESIETETDPAGRTLINIETKRACSAEFAIAGRVMTVKLRRPTLNDGTLLGKTIVVDAGHGGKDSGALSNSKAVKEKDLALKTAIALSKKLTDAGANVIMTRTEDVFVGLGERVDIANSSGCDMFISVHYNSSGNANRASGIMVFHHGGSVNGQLLAKCINSEIASKGLLPDRGAVSDKRIYKTGFKVLRETKMTGVLLELGFLSHDYDTQVVNSDEFRESVVNAIVDGMKIFLGEKK